MASRKEEIINERNKVRKFILRKSEATSLFKEKHNSKRNIVIVADFSDQRTGKTTYYVTYCINKFFITICYLPQHRKLFEIWLDIHRSYVAKKIKRRNFKKYRILNMHGKDKKRTDNIKTMHMLEFPEYGETDYLCVAYKYGEEGRKITEARKSNNLPAGFCRMFKREEETDPICPYKEECFNIRQLNKIIRKIKGGRLIYLENKEYKDGKTPADIKKIKDAIKEAKQTHWLILLPHAYLGNINTKKIFEAFSGEFYKKKEIATIIDESILDLSLKTLNISRSNIMEVIDFFEDKRRHLSHDEDLFGIYNELSDLLITIKINTDFNQAEINNRRRLNEAQKLVYDKSRTIHKRDIILTQLKVLREQAPDLLYLDELNNKYKIALQKYAFRSPYNIFNSLINLLRDVKNIRNFNKVKEMIVINLRDKNLKYPLNNKSSFVYNVERSKITIFADAKGTEEKYYKMLPPKYRKYLMFIKRINMSNFTVRCLYDGSKASKYQFQDLVYNPRTHRMEKQYNNKFDNQVKRTAYLIYCYTKIKNKIKIMIALSKEFNNGKKEEKKWDGYMMHELMTELFKVYGIKFRDLDIKLGFFYAEAGMSKFDDREVLIFFNMPGIPAEITRMTILFFGLSKDIVDEHYQDKEQEQMAGRITNFGSLISKEVVFLVDSMEVSPYFEERRIMRGITNTLNYPRLIKHLEEHSELTTLEIRDQLYSHRPINSVRDSLKRIFEEDFILNHRGTTEYTWFLKNS